MNTCGKLVGCLCLIMLLGGLVGAADELMIYEGEAAAAPGKISIGAWGSGTCKEVTDRYFIGPGALKITTQGFYQGARLEFEKPVDFSAFFGKKNTYLELKMQFPKSAAAATTPGAVPGAGGEGQFIGDPQTRKFHRPTCQLVPQIMQKVNLQSYQEAIRQGYQPCEYCNPSPAPAPGVPGVPGEEGMVRPGELAVQPPDIEALRIVLLTEKGQLAAEPVPFKPAIIERKEWLRIAIPLANFMGKVPKDQMKVKRMLICGDGISTFFIGQMKLVVDNSPVTAQLSVFPPESTVGREITFSAQVEAGDAQTRVTWDFDEKDGIQVEAVGEKVSKIYRKPGEYQVTCVVSDITGGKAPFSTTINVRVLE